MTFNQSFILLTEEHHQVYTTLKFSARTIVQMSMFGVTITMQEEDGYWSKKDKMENLTLTGTGWSMKMDLAMFILSFGMG